MAALFFWSTPTSNIAYFSVLLAVKYFNFNLRLKLYVAFDGLQKLKILNVMRTKKRQAVIKLIGKKHKDNPFIKDWRPKVDYKIISKVFMLDVKKYFFC